MIRLVSAAASVAAFAVAMPALANPGYRFSVGVPGPNSVIDSYRFSPMANPIFGVGEWDRVDRLAQANAALADRDYARASRLAITASDPARSSARYIAGLAQAGQGDFVAARRLLKDAVAKRRRFTEAETALALVHVRLGERDAASVLRERLAARVDPAGNAEEQARLAKAVALIDRAL